jgi:hypothetical protein
MLRASRASLQVPALQSLKHFRELDIGFNQKCGRQSLADMLRQELSPVVHLTMTINFPRPENDTDFVGASAADRDASLLRSQLEPWSTTALRRRLVSDFGEDVLPPEVTRGAVMERLLALYNMNSCLEQEPRTMVRVQGSDNSVVDKTLRDELLVALRVWLSGSSCSDGNQERPSIRAEHYMILTSPSLYVTYGSKKTIKEATKLAEHQQIWDLAQTAMASVDPAFASKYTALAVTHGFQGSPHIDRQNVGPFYGMALGDFEEGTGEIMVECSARVVARVNTKNRLAAVDGRYPHWVGDYDLTKERFSLIYYRTAGDLQAVGPAVFQVPTY